MEARLKSLDDVGQRVHESRVLGAVAMNGSIIRPYLLWWSGLGSDLVAERDYTGSMDLSVLDWRCQINCVGSNPGVALAVADQVFTSLANLPVAGGWLKVDENALRSANVMSDTQEVPARFFVPLSWRLITN